MLQLHGRLFDLTLAIDRLIYFIDPKLGNHNCDWSKLSIKKSIRPLYTELWGDVSYLIGYGCLTYLCADTRRKQNCNILMRPRRAKLPLCMEAELSCCDKNLAGILTYTCGLVFIQIPSQRVNLCWECETEKRGSFCVVWLCLQQQLSRNPSEKWTLETP